MNAPNETPQYVCRQERSLTGPVLMITLGVLLLLSKLDVVHFHTTWPLLLIVAGVLVLLRRSGWEDRRTSEVNHV